MNENKEVKYKNSILATILLIIGSAYESMVLMFPVVFVYEAFNSGFTDDTIVIIFVAPCVFLIGFLLKKLGQKIEDRKKYKFWLKFITENDYIEKIKNDDNFAKNIYDNSPNKKCRKYLIELNSSIVNI